ncbi:MAG: hypothetical protein LH614_07970 [Pyrinomonadaceae bacterium]|nr:hypothetical protein [Pyrinomonadaceae bacterium]
MKEAEIKFERENLEGIMPIGTYLADAAGRMGVGLYRELFGKAEFAVVKITKGGELLSAPTKTEIKHLSAEKRESGERLAEQAKIEKSGEIVIMTTKQPEEVKPDYEMKREAYRKEFEDLPLEKKIASLVELESIALSETFSFVINSPSKIVGKLIDLLAEFGFKIEDEAKKQARPAEHQPDEEPSVKETAHQADEKPSVKEAEHQTDESPSVKDDKVTDEKEAPPPSV